MKGESGARVLVEAGGGRPWSVAGERRGAGERGGGMGDG